MQATKKQALTASAIGLTALLIMPQAHAQPTQPTPQPHFTNVTVHDPSVVTSGDDIWIFGSHGASAKTTDLLNWTQHTSDLSQDRNNKLFEDIYTELKETFDWAQSDTLWASDVIELPDGRFAMYYNACKGDSPRSALGLAIADTVDGPYKDQGILLKSGMWGQESENPGEIYNALIHPNAVDPDAFYDENGDLWMVYGSYSGGIYILKMDRQTGLPLPDQGYGKHLIGGNHSRIEAPTIQYNPDTGYYYMYVSFGGLDSTGGYNMRVARSTTPDGPYLDAHGNNMADAKSDPSLPLFDDASIEPYGVKLMGSHVFTRELGDPATNTPSTLGVGYQSPGHNSWYQDPDTGKMFLIFHTRFPGAGELHQVRTQQIWFNRAGWPVLSPMQYAGETNGKIKRSEVEGTWQVINMGNDINTSAKESENITLTSNGKITGAYSGKWKLTAQHNAELTLNGDTYTGVFTPIWDPQYSSWSVGLTVLNADGEALIGRAAPTLTPTQAATAVSQAIDLGNTNAVTGNLDLPTTGTHGTTITWATSDETVVTATGRITRPAVGETPRTATLTATIRNVSTELKRTFNITVLPRESAQLSAAWNFENNLNDATANFAPATETGAKLDQPGTTAQYVADGVKGSALRLDGNSGVRLPNGLINSDTYSVSMWLRPETLTQYTSAFFGAANPESWISLVPRGHNGVNGNAMIWSGTQWYDAGTNTNLPTNAWSHVAFVNDKGTLSVYIDGTLTFEGGGFPNVFTNSSAEFGLGVNWWDTPFKGSIDELSVWKSALSPLDVAELAAL